MYRETIFRFGPNEQFVGILTEPSNCEASSTGTMNRSRSASCQCETECTCTAVKPPIAILLNAGIVHRVGPHRMNVQIARSLANAGFRSLRLDLSGLGDSPIRGGTEDAATRAVMDIQDAFDQLEKLTQVNRFVVMGLCSGSFHAHQVSLVDNRVTGAIFIDGFAFATAEHAERKRRSKLRYRFVRNAIKRRLKNLKAIESLDSSGEVSEQGQFFEQCTDRRVIADQIRTLLDQGQRLYYIYTGGHPDFSAEEQFSEMFDIPLDHQQVNVKYFASAEHTFPIVDHRNQLTQAIVDWYQGFSNKGNVADLCSSAT